MLITGERSGTAARRAGLAAVATTILLVTGCSTVVDGHPSAAPRPTDPVRTPTVTPTPDFPSSSPSAAVTPAQLNGKLMAAPAGSIPWGDNWGDTTFPTVKQFVNREYPPQNVSTVITEFKEQGLTSITHRTWIAKNGTQADVVLFAFSSDGGAEDRYEIASEAQGNNAGVVSVPFSASHEAAAYRHSTADRDGYVTAIVYSHSGPVVVEIFTYSPKKRFDAASTEAWSKAQIARI